jgi:hypothetical protein
MLRTSNATQTNAGVCHFPLLQNHPKKMYLMLYVTTITPNGFGNTYKHTADVISRCFWRDHLLFPLDAFSEYVKHSWYGLVT